MHIPWTFKMRITYIFASYLLFKYRPVLPLSDTEVGCDNVKIYEYARNGPTEVLLNYAAGLSEIHDTNHNAIAVYSKHSVPI